MIWDCFTYYNELEVLEIRFRELADTVDYFVLVEASQTFRGQHKPYYFDRYEDFFTPWLDKIIQVQIDFPKDIEDPWVREELQRDAIMDGIIGARPDDIILFSDADEIPRASVVRELKLGEQAVQLDVDLYYMNFNWRVPKVWNQGGRPMAVLRKHMVSPHWHRQHPTGHIIPNGGWHFSYFGGIPFMQNKIKSFSHSEVDTPEWTDERHLQACLENGLDPFERFKLEYSPIDQTYPQWVQDNPDYKFWKYSDEV